MANLTDFPTIRPNFLMDFANSGQIDPRIEFSRSTTATRVNQKGMIENVPANVPRIDYDRSSGACLGMLVEGQSTNILLYSSDMTHEYWQKIKAGAGNTPVVTQVVGLGGASGSRVQMSLGGAGDGDQSSLLQGFRPTTIGQIYVASFYIKAFDAANVGKKVAFRGVGGSGYQVITLTADFVKVAVSETAVITSSEYMFQLRGELASSSVDFVVVANQLEPGGPSSYIYTENTMVTRGPDITNITGNNFDEWYSQGRGTFSISVTPSYAPAGLDAFTLILQGAAGDSVGLRSYGSVYVANIVKDYAPLADVAVGYVFAGNDYVTTLAWGSGSAAFCFNGGEVVAQAAEVPDMSRLALGHNGSGLSNFTGHIRRFAFYPARLTPEQMRRINA